jgi:hypothetical protein
MARRANAKQHPLMWLIVVIVLVGFVGVGYFVFNKSSEPFRTLPTLEISQYLENANSLRGNTYKVDAVVQNSLAWSPAKGRLFSVEVGTNKEVVPLLIPPNLNQVNVQKGQRYFFKVEIIKDGVIQVLEMTKF